MKKCNLCCPVIYKSDDSEVEMKNDYASQLTAASTGTPIWPFLIQHFFESFLFVLFCVKLHVLKVVGNYCKCLVNF